MKIFLETKDANAHRIVFVGKNGKLVYSGEWVRRKASAYQTLQRHIMDVMEQGIDLGGMITERPYRAANFPKNSGPKKKK